MDVSQKRERKSHIKIGEIYFWNATINNWQRLLYKDDFKDIIVNSLIYLTEKNKIEVFAFIIMPNHIHLIWRIKEMNGKEMPHVSFLKNTAHEFKKKLKVENINWLEKFSVNAPNKEYEFWQRDSLAIDIYTRFVAFQKLDYLHNNPLAIHWKLAKEPADYIYSSAKYYETVENRFLFIKDLRDEFY